MISLDYTPALADGSRVGRPDFAARPLPLPNAVELCAVEAAVPSDIASALPAQPNRSVENAGWHALWIAPRRWLLIAEEAGALRQFLVAVPSQMRMIDVSHSRTGFRLEGGAVRTVLGKGTPLDLRPRHFGPGQCAHTWCAGFRILLDHRPDAIDVHVGTSHAASFWTWLQNASATL